MVSETLQMPTVHADHLQWQSEHAAWYKESQEWLSECRAAWSGLSQLEQEFQDQCESIDMHRESIDSLECSCLQHEGGMNVETDPSSAVQLKAELARRHAQQAELHQRHEALHRKLRGRQRAIMAKLAGT